MFTFITGLIFIFTISVSEHLYDLGVHPKESMKPFLFGLVLVLCGFGLDYKILSS